MIFFRGYQRQGSREEPEPVFFFFFFHLLNPDTIFLVSFTNQSEVTMESQGWNLFTATRLHLAASSSFSSSPPPPQQRRLREQKWQHLSEEPNDCLHCWNSGLTSWVRPHLADRQHTLFSHFSFPSLYQDHMQTKSHCWDSLSNLPQCRVWIMFCLFYISYWCVFTVMLPWRSHRWATFATQATNLYITINVELHQKKKKRRNKWAHQTRLCRNCALISLVSQAAVGVTDIFTLVSNPNEPL